VIKQENKSGGARRAQVDEKFTRLVEKREGKIPKGRRISRWEDNTKMDVI
jgi:hypothetical protein